MVIFHNYVTNYKRGTNCQLCSLTQASKSSWSWPKWKQQNITCRRHGRFWLKPPRSITVWLRRQSQNPTEPTFWSKPSPDIRHGAMWHNVPGLVGGLGESWGCWCCLQATNYSTPCLILLHFRRSGVKNLKQDKIGNCGLNEAIYTLQTKGGGLNFWSQAQILA